jgi:hypothetical protein
MKWASECGEVVVFSYASSSMVELLRKYVSASPAKK